MDKATKVKLIALEGQILILVLQGTLSVLDFTEAPKQRALQSETSLPAVGRTEYSQRWVEGHSDQRSSLGYRLQSRKEDVK